MVITPCNLAQALCSISNIPPKPANFPPFPESWKMSSFFSINMFAQNFGIRTFPLSTREAFEEPKRGAFVGIKHHIIKFWSAQQIHTARSLFGNVQNLAFQLVIFFWTSPFTLPVSDSASSNHQNPSPISLGKKIHAVLFAEIIKIVAESQIALAHFRQNKQCNERSWLE